MKRIFQPLPGEDHVPTRVLVAFAAVVLSAMLGLAALAYTVNTNRNRIDEISTVRDGLCNVRDSKIRALLRGERFIVDHPGGTPDFSRELLDSINVDVRREIRDYRPLNCGGLPEPPSVSRLG